jgi:hypothetical protein
MEPVTTLIVTAAALGAATGLKPTAEQMVKDAYAGFKRVIIDHYGDYRDLIDSLEFLAEKPEDANRQAALAEELNNAEATKDLDLIEAAKAIHAVVEAYSPETHAVIGMDIKKLKATRLEVEKVQPPDSGIGVSIGEADIRDVASFKDIGGGQAERKGSGPNP